MLADPRQLVLALLAASLVSATARAQLTAQEAEGQLEAHNQVRANVSPTAANMTRLTWDAGLAGIAQSWTGQCNFSHNPAAGAGENLFLTTGGTHASALASSVPTWAAEAANYNYMTNSCAAGQCGHYTQIVWAKTLRVGCGITFCPTVINLPAFNNAYFVACNYRPAGNFVGQRPYVAGAIGSACPPELPNLVGGLCSPATTVASVPVLPPLAAAALLVLLAGFGWLYLRRSARTGAS